MRTRLSMGWAIAALVCVLTMSQVTRATTPDWDALDADTHKLLAPWQDHWNAMALAERERLLANARRWQSMDASAQADLLKRQALWQALPPAERARRRARYAAWKALPADEQARVLAAAGRLARLPVPQQGALRAGFAAQDANQQTAWLLGPSTGSWIEQAHVLFAYVPEAERDATLRMLQSMPSDVRERLFTLARRLPGDQREALRRQLLISQPSQRAALVDQRLAQ